MEIGLISIAVSLLLLIVLGVVLFIVVNPPSLNRDWSPDQSIMPGVNFNADGTVQITNIRNIHYRTSRDYDLAYYDRNIDPDNLSSAWLAISPFTGPGFAHAFISFGFNDGTYLAVSVEIRRKKGQKFSPVKAFLRQFEMMYVLADELDVIRVRTNCVKYTVRLFPMDSEHKRIKAVFLDILKRTDKLGKEPEFYNTLWNNCTTNIIKHTRRFSDRAIPVWNYRYLFPESLDKIAYRVDLIDTDLSYEEAREYFDVTSRAQAVEGGSEFSAAIRAPMTVPSQ